MRKRNKKAMEDVEKKFTELQQATVQQLQDLQQEQLEIIEKYKRQKQVLQDQTDQKIV